MADKENKTQIDRDLDLRGEVCPFTFVKSKLALEQMSSGQVIKIIVDNSESASNVPRSIELEGHEVLGVSLQEKSTWGIVVKKV